MADESVGTIYYEVEADTSRLVNGGKRVDGALDGMQKSFAKTDTAARSSQMQLTKTAEAVQELGRQAQAAQNPLSGLAKLIGGFVTLRGATGIVSMADAYTDLQNRLRLVTDGHVQLAAATEDVFRIAQETSQSVDSTAQVYQRFAQNAKALGLNLDGVAKLTSTVSKAVAISGASAAAADAAMTQFGQALASGTLRGDELNSVMEQTPALAKAIADGLGITIGELRNVASEGRITGQELIKALMNAADSVEANFGTRVKTASQSMTDLHTALLKFVGEANNSSGASAALSNAIGLLANNLETVVNVLMVAGAGALARYIALSGAAALASIKSALEARNEAAAQLRLAQAQVAATAAASAHAAASVGLGVAAGNAATAAKAHTAALAAQAAAQRVASAAGVGLLGLLGGPIGIIALAASAATSLYLWHESTNKVKVSIDDLGVSLESTTRKMAEMTTSQRKMAVDAAQIDLAKAVEDLDAAYRDLAGGSLADGTRAVAQWRAANSSAISELIVQAKSGAITYKELDDRLVAMAEAYAEANGRSAAWVRQVREEISSVTEAARQHENAKSKLGMVADAARDLEGAARGAASGVNGMVDAMAGISGEPGKYLKSLTSGFESLQDDGSRFKEAQRQIASWGDKVGPELAKKILDTAAAFDRLRDSQKNARMSSRFAGKEDSAQAYYYGLVAANETALAKIDAEEKKALEENDKRRARDQQNAAIYDAARTEIAKKFARERAKFEEQSIRDTAAFNIEMATDQEKRLAAIRDEAVRRADASVKLGVATVEEGERQKALALKAYARDSANLQEQVAQTAADNKIAAAQFEADKIGMIYAEAVRRADAQYQAGAITFAKAEQDKVKAALDAGNAMRALLAQNDPMANEQQIFAQKMASLQKLNDAKLIDDQRYRDLSLAAETTHQQQMLALQEQTFAAQSAGNQLLIDGLNQLQQVGSTALIGLFEGTTTAADAMRSLGSAILNEVVGSFVKMGIEQVKAWVMGQAAQTAAASAYVASVTGQVAANTALAAQAAFASTAAIPMVGPQMAPAAAAAAGSAAAALGAPAVAGASASLAGGRQHGGPVSADKMYRINETGVPEILNTASGRQYMLPNARGEVVSNADATKSGSGGTSVTLNLNEDASRAGTVERTAGERGDEVINAFVSNIRKRGAAAQAMEATYGLSRVGR